MDQLSLHALSLSGPPVPPWQKLDDEGGWDDDWDRYYDYRGANFERIKERYKQSIRKYGRPLGDVNVLEQTYRSRGYDPLPEDYDRQPINLDDNEATFTAIVKLGAQHAVNLYNYRTSKNLEIVKIQKAYRYPLGVLDFKIQFNITFQAQEQGKPDTLNVYQTKVETTWFDRIVGVPSFRAKPLTGS